MRNSLYLILLICTLTAGMAHAAQSDCQITFTGITFSDYDSTNTSPDDAIGTINITCSNSNTFRFVAVAITPETGRTMTSGGNSLAYNLYTNSTRSNVWGDASDPAYIIISNSCGSRCVSTNLTVYGRIPAQQVVVPGGVTLSQTVSVTLSDFSGGTDSTTGVVQVKTAGACTVSSVGTMNFGSLGLAFMTTDKTGVSANISYLCTTGLSATITLGQGSNPAAGSSDSAPARRMRLGATANYVSYNLYKDAGAGQVWGNTAATGVGPIAGTGVTQSKTVYGKAIHTTVPVGSYADTVVVTVSF